MAPFSTDVGKAVPPPQAFQGLHGVQSIEIKYDQERVFGEHVDRCDGPLPPLACGA